MAGTISAISGPAIPDSAIPDSVIPPEPPRPDPIPIQPHTGQRIIVFHVLNDPAHPDCAPLDEIKLLLRIGAMPRLSTLWGRLPGGDCSAIADAMLLDLRDTGRQHG
jgi:hypothetical protein